MEKKQAIEFQNVPDEDLFFYMSCKNEDPSTANMAFNEFYTRYKKYTFEVCRKLFISRNRFDEEDLKSFYHNVFLKIYEKAGEITIDSSIAAHERKFVILKIISQFINYEGKTYMKSSGNKSLEVEFTDEVLNNVPEENLEKIESIESKVLNKALNSLKEKNRLILLEYYRYEREDDDKKNWTPTEALDEMCEYFDTTRNALRKTKERAFNKVKEYIEQYEKLKVLK